MRVWSAPPRIRVLLCLALIAGIMAALCLAPATAWLARRHMRLCVTSPYSDPCLRNLGLDRFRFYGKRAAASAFLQAPPAAGYTTDVLSALATLDRPGHRSAYPDTTARATELRLLAARFQDSPEILALLVFENSHGLNTGYRREHWIGATEPYRRPPDAGSPDPMLARLYDADCARGERLDPTNAYFPAMRAHGQFAVGNDSAALASLDRAGKAGKWDDYGNAQAMGVLREMDRRGDDRSLASRAAAFYYLTARLLYTNIRALARVGVGQAIYAEKAGRKLDGIRIRHALVRMGALMRADSHTLVGSLNGSAICGMALYMPGGVRAAKPPDSRLGNGQWRSKRYLDYLRAAGAGSEAEWTKRVLEENDRGRVIALATVGHDSVAGMTVLLCMHIAGLAALVALIWLLVAAALSARACETPRVREGRSMPSAQRWAFAAGFLLFVALCLAMRAGWMNTFQPFVVAGTAIGAIIALARRDSPGSHWWRYALATALGLFLLVWLARSPLSGLFGLLRAVDLLHGAPSPGPQWRPEREQALIQAALLLLLVPFAALVVAIGGLVRRLPLSVALSRGWRVIALPLALLMCVTYAVLVVRQAQSEARACALLDAEIRHEGRAMAARAGTTWPRTIGGIERRAH